MNAPMLGGESYYKPDGRSVGDLVCTGCNYPLQFQKVIISLKNCALIMVHFNRLNNYLDLAAVFFVFLVEHSIVTISEFVLCNPLCCVLPPLGRYPGHLGPASKVHLKPLLLVGGTSYPAVIMMKATQSWTVGSAVHTGSRYRGIRDVSIFQSQSSHARRRLGGSKSCRKNTILRNKLLR